MFLSAGIIWMEIPTLWCGSLLQFFFLTGLVGTWGRGKGKLGSLESGVETYGLHWHCWTQLLTVAWFSYYFSHYNCAVSVYCRIIPTTTCNSQNNKKVSIDSAIIRQWRIFFPFHFILSLWWVWCKCLELE